MRFYGIIGFVTEEETSPGIWERTVSERPYYGDVVRSSRRWDEPTEVNDRLNISNEITIVADNYANDNLAYMAYVVWQNKKWAINYVEVNRPRIRLTIGGEYNESKPTRN